MRLPGSSKRIGPFRSPWIVGGVLALLLAVGVGAAVFLRNPAAGPGEAVVSDSAARRGKPMTFSEIFERVSPAVVSVNLTSTVDPLARGPQDLFDLAPPEEGGPPEEEGGPVMQRSSGSGFFISPEGLLLTNNHVVEDDGEITVALKDGRELPAVIVGRDENTDLALLRVRDPADRNAKFAYVDFEVAAKPRVGDWIIAIGNPFGLGGSATAGIISAYGRDIDGGLVDFIQLDAPINRGNSGGPSFDVYGRVIGVNTAIYSPTGGSVGIGFAVPAEVAAQVANQLKSGVSITRGWLGASVATLSPAQADRAGVEAGVAIVALDRRGPGAVAGLRPGDVVVSVDREPTRTSSVLTRAVAKIKPGETVRLRVVRDGRRRTVAVRVGQRPPTGRG
ncbi:MAG TPA: trypsin-like peptidase domain-containing protein [Caulobacteraceae bacterium]|nr:trypsin-like peptidase domain-containing protein [Caulobacteraceae bacterium]